MMIPTYVEYTFVYTFHTLCLVSDKQKREEQQQQGSASAAVMKEPLNAAEVYSSGSDQESSSSSGSDSDQGDSEDEAGGRWGIEGCMCVCMWGGVGVNGWLLWYIT